MERKNVVGALRSARVQWKTTIMSYGGRKKHTQALLKSINEKNKKETVAVETVRTGQHFGHAPPRHCASDFLASCSRPSADSSGRAAHCY